MPFYQLISGNLRDSRISSFYIEGNYFNTLELAPGRFIMAAQPSR
jgi:hypothetical protein